MNKTERSRVKRIYNSAMTSFVNSIRNHPDLESNKFSELSLIVDSLATLSTASIYMKLIDETEKNEYLERTGAKK